MDEEANEAGTATNANAANQASEAIDFDRAAFESSEDAALNCQVCSKPIDEDYFTANGKPVCGACRVRVEAQGAGSMFKALLFGVIAGVAGAAVYGAITALTGYNLALITILVGIAVGYAVRFGAGANRGAKYRVLAVGLAWLAMGSVYIPPGELGVLGMLLGAAIVPFFLVAEAEILAVIIFGFGIWEAWKLSAPRHATLEGPFEAPEPAARASVPAAVEVVEVVAKPS
jgi:hypothetical protein